MKGYLDLTDIEHAVFLLDLRASGNGDHLFVIVGQVDFTITQRAYDLAALMLAQVAGMPGMTWRESAAEAAQRLRERTR